MSHASQIIARHSLAGELTVVVVVKIILLVLAGVFLFGADHRLTVDESIMTHHILDQNPPSTTR